MRALQVTFKLYCYNPPNNTPYRYFLQSRNDLEKRNTVNENLQVFFKSVKRLKLALSNKTHFCSTARLWVQTINPIVFQCLFLHIFSHQLKSSIVNRTGTFKGKIMLPNNYITELYTFFFIKHAVFHIYNFANSKVLQTQPAKPPTVTDQYSRVSALPVGNIFNPSVFFVCFF